MIPVALNIQIYTFPADIPVIGNIFLIFHIFIIGNDCRGNEYAIFQLQIRGNIPSPYQFLLQFPAMAEYGGS